MKIFKLPKDDDGKIKINQGLTASRLELSLLYQRSPVLPLALGHKLQSYLYSPDNFKY
jgi:hypothetical protein